MTHAELIKALGGGTVISYRLFKVSGKVVDREAIYKWRKRNSIPWKWRSYLSDMARECEVGLPENFYPGVKV